MPCVLVVDDEHYILRVCSDTLKLWGLDVVTAADGAEALQVLKTRTIDLVVSDLCMPRLNGLQLLDAVQRDYPGLPFCLMTGNSETVDLEDVRKRLQGFIQKPFVSQGLREIVSRVFSSATMPKTENPNRGVKPCHNGTSSDPGHPSR